jgi:adenosylcobinamide-GDP ribazoletransferase
VCLAALLERTSALTTAFVLVVAHAASRFTAVTFLVTHEYARFEGESKSKPLATRMTNGELAFASASGLLPLLLLLPVFSWYIFLVLVPMVLVKWYAGRLFVRWIQGYTGDCLGATQQVAEVAFYLSCVILLNVIHLFVKF